MQKMCKDEGAFPQDEGAFPQDEAGEYTKYSFTSQYYIGVV